MDEKKDGKEMAFLFFHEDPAASERRTFAAVVVYGEAAYLACSKLSRKDTYSRRKGNDIALHRAVRLFTALRAELKSDSEKRLLARALEYDFICLPAFKGNDYLCGARSASIAILKELVTKHSFQPRPHPVRTATSGV